MEAKKRVILVIRDGWGHGAHDKGNAIFLAKTPNHDSYKTTYPCSLLQCTGNFVGNPNGVQGGSEVGHLTIGAGRIVWQPYELINKKIESKEFFENPALLDAIRKCKDKNSDLHLDGLFSDQGIHADYRHMHAILELCKKENFDRVYIHLTLDGRDVPEKSASKFIEETQKAIDTIGVGKIASLIGRYYAMDRDRNWDRTKAAYDLLVNGKGFPAKNPLDGLKLAYERGDKTDYYVQPTVVINQNNEPIACVKENDSFIWYNFRSDRSRQITAMLMGLDYCPQIPEGRPNINYVCFSVYDSNWNIPVAFPQTKVENNLGQTVSKYGLTQLRIAETEKYAHVTFFFNSQEDLPYEKEDRILVDSPKVSSYDQKPEMSAYEVTEKVLPEIGKYDLIVLNFANPDLVGHSGVLDATIKACEVVDECVGRVVEKARQENYTILLMGDHGNADHMLYENGEPDPSHGFNPVLLTIISEEKKELNDGSMQDIAPTILDILGVEKPNEMTGKSLFK
ncbi:2,3-bisphosphoglycerate-independent phosphoglycerate mutase [Candidatus Woesearchaeota archaeon]|nr:2,3-bisphosphoglycerate-independent phosphoglycerate mutase [Candidatus Woesearchaeota archaeon]